MHSASVSVLLNTELFNNLFLIKSSLVIFAIEKTTARSSAGRAADS